jgi:heptosyltransferase III
VGVGAIATALPYWGENLGPAPHVAVVFCDHIGDFVVATPLMRGLRERFPDLILDYFGGEGTREIEAATSLVDARYSLFGNSRALQDLPRFVDERRAAAGPYGLVVNLEAEPLAAQATDLLRPRYLVAVHGEPGAKNPPLERGIDRLKHEVWNRPDLIDDYPELESQFIGEIYCRLARVKTDYTRVEAPSEPPPFSTPHVLMSTGASRGARLWPRDHWIAVAEWLRSRGEEVGLLGAPLAENDRYHAARTDAALITHGVLDLRGALTLPEVGGALARARAFLTIDNGLMHIGIAVGAPTIALFGASPRRIWVTPKPTLTVLDPDEPCTLCEENRFRNADCLLPIHQCMLSVRPERVIEELKGLLQS